MEMMIVSLLGEALFFLPVGIVIVKAMRGEL